MAAPSRLPITKPAVAMVTVEKDVSGEVLARGHAAELAPDRSPSE